MRRLARLANPRVEKWANELAGLVLDCEVYGISALDCIDTWLRERFRYRGEIEEVLRTPDFMLQSLESRGYFDGDCDDISTLAAALLIRLGYPARFVAIRYDGPDFKHVFVQVGSYVIDPTVAKGTPYIEQERMEVFA